MENPSRADELKMMQDPTAWPQWPLLPIKKRPNSWNDPKGTGCLFADQQPVVYYINMWSVKSQADIRAAEKEVYENFESLVDAGWIVD